MIGRTSLSSSQQLQQQQQWLDWVRVSAAAAAVL